MKIHFEYVALALLVIGSVQASENPQALPRATLPVKTLAVFKNGLAFVGKSGEIQLKDGWALLDRPPAAALGTLWISSASKRHPVTEVIGYKEKITESAEPLSHSELLAANVGKRVTLTFTTGGSSKTLEGTILSAPPERALDEEALAPPLTSSRASWRPPGEPARGEIVLFKTVVKDRPVVMSISKFAIQTIELGDDAAVRTPVEKEFSRLKARVDGNPARVELDMACLEKGLVWSPSYRINIAKEGTADLVLEAILANDVEALNNVEVNFVVGYPNFLYADLLSPLALQQSVASFIQSLLAGRRADQPSPFANTMSQAVIYNEDRSLRPETAYSATQTMPGETSEDLYIYRKSGVTLLKGERAQYLLLNVSVPYQHLYQWEIPESMNVDDRGYRQDSGPRREAENRVWHVLRLENTCHQPWTTAPALTLNGQIPLAQDILNYTPPGAKSLLKLTVATDVRADQSQTEVARKPMTLENRPFDEVIVAGKLKVTNWKAKEARLVVKKSLVGEVVKAEQDATVTKVARRLTSVNPTSEIAWEFSLPAGKDKELNYQYRVLVYR